MSNHVDDDPQVPEPDAETAAEAGGAAPRAPRMRVLKGAHAAFNQEFSAIPCTVRDLSETGAKLEFEGGWFVPEQFTLHVDVDGYKVECRRLWHRGRFCGVAFIGDRIRTGSARQQVIAPDTEVDKTGVDKTGVDKTGVDGAPGGAAATLGQTGPKTGAFSGGDMPARRRPGGAAGFGRRTR
ncbi:MAG: PilZ domain-containing protein [Hoeflea sp.]|uniref:PilZ domain-containing protein n=1 Tax=Hoeflea sp. TaxID=1940281 RepID=UPI0032EAAD0D